MESEAYEEGYMSFEVGYSILDNPYEYPGEEYDDWQQGYRIASDNSGEEIDPWDI